MFHSRQSKWFHDFSLGKLCDGKGSPGGTGVGGVDLGINRLGRA